MDKGEPSSRRSSSPPAFPPKDDDPDQITEVSESSTSISSHFHTKAESEILGLLSKSRQVPVDTDALVPNATKALIRYDIITFTEDELQVYTKNFAKARGHGGHSDVYEGQITGRAESKLNGMAIAVKASRTLSDSAKEQWKTEVETIPRFNHKNIIRLIGTCETATRLYLVFPLMEKGSLKDNLTDLSWNKTLKIIKGVTLALREVHCYSWFVFVDLKPANVLLDKDYTPKLTDFGLVRQEGICLSAGTVTNTDPAIFTGEAAYKSGDIWSLGILILQLIMKRKIISQATNEASSMIRDWAKEEYFKNSHAVDGRLRQACKEVVAISITRLGLECTKLKAEDRPTVDHVLEVIVGIEGNRFNKLLRKFP